MCLIIHKPKGKTQIPKTYLDNAESKNKDGFGIVYLDNGQLETTMDYKKARKLVEAKRPFVAHYRYATRGKINEANCHPFSVYKDDENYWLFSNGTVAQLGSKDVCDTKVVTDILEELPTEYWSQVLSFTDTRFAIVDTQHYKVKRYGEWHKKEGVYYSKSDCFATYNATNKYYNWSSPNYTSYSTKPCAIDTPIDDDYDDWSLDPVDVDYHATKEIQDYNRSFGIMGGTTLYSWKDNPLVAVYGTLKSSKGNHRSFLSECELVDEGQTVNKYPLQVNHGLPYVYDAVGKGNHIKVEVYETMDVAAQRDLDMLEAHPTHYTRKQIPVELNSGELVNAWLYFSADSNYNQNQTMLQSY